MRRGIGALSKVVVVTVVAGILPIAAAGTAYAGRVRTIVITDASRVEGDVGSAAMSFTISWTGARGPSAVTVAYATADASATAGADYTTASGTATLSQSGCHCATVTVPVLGDLITEGTETFQVNLTNPVNGVIGDAQGIGTIYDNEGPPSLVVTDVSAAEGAQASFSVQLTNASASTVTVDYATADGSAIVGSD
ncbi:MAG: Calx-beta domain-containing protein, partial [Actinomycetota bacterium]